MSEAPIREPSKRTADAATEQRNRPPDPPGHAATTPESLPADHTAEPAADAVGRQPQPAPGGLAETDPATDAPPPSFLWLRPGDQLFIGVMLTISLVLMCAHWVRLSAWGLREVEIERQPARAVEYRIPINSATWVEWSQLEGIGETLAMRIVADREQNGPFATVDDLQRVPGIGPKKLEAMRPWLTNEAPHAAGPPEPSETSD